MRLEWDSVGGHSALSPASSLLRGCACGLGMCSGTWIQKAPYLA